MGSIILSIINAVLGILLLLSHIAVVSVIFFLIRVVINILMFLLLSWMGWFCTVKKKGCCGKIGYVLWAIVFLILPLMCGGLTIAEAQLAGLVYLLMLVPVAYMIIACIQLFIADSRQGIATAA